MTWFRIYFSKGRRADRWSVHETLIVDGEAQRDQILARGRPKAIYWEICQEHVCSTCGRRWPWQDGCWWFGCDEDVELGRPIRKFCRDCGRPPGLERLKRVDGASYNQWVKTSQFEPDHDGSVHQRYVHMREIREAPTAHRKVPMPDWPGPGMCRWCLKPTIWESGKRKGQPAKRNWHNACYYQYRLHSELAAQFDFLFDRDGPFCQICGAGGYALARTFDQIGEDDDPKVFWAVTYLKPSIVLEVDHVIPLWRAADYAPAFRQALYGPENLWLLGQGCHKEKTAIEAAERAERRRTRNPAPFPDDGADVNGARHEPQST